MPINAPREHRWLSPRHHERSMGSFAAAAYAGRGLWLGYSSHSPTIVGLAWMQMIFDRPGPSLANLFGTPGGMVAIASRSPMTMSTASHGSA